MTRQIGRRFLKCEGGEQNTPATSLPRAAAVSGDVSASEDLLVEGTVSGTIDMPGYALTIAAGARVDARILARDVTILGTVSGRIR